jgi:hypothetical protein
MLDLQKRREVSALVAKLMSHYWTADDPEPIRRAQAEDWIADLVEFDLADIVAAITVWRRDSTHRPTIAHIRQLCIAEEASRNTQSHYLALAGPPDPEAIAHRAGFASQIARRDAIRAQQERYVKAQAWRNAGKPHPGAFAFTVENIREARRQLDCDDEWPIDLRWSAG